MCPIRARRSACGLALVEEAVRYVGGNQLRFHHRVVRDLPGGAAGIALKAKTGKQQATVDLAKLRERLTEYLTEVGKKTPFPNESRPLDLKNLYVVAFVQNDENKEVLQSVQVKVGRASKRSSGEPSRVSDRIM